MSYALIFTLGVVCGIGLFSILTLVFTHAAAQLRQTERSRGLEVNPLTQGDRFTVRRGGRS